MLCNVLLQIVKINEIGFFLVLGKRINENLNYEIYLIWYLVLVN